MNTKSDHLKDDELSSLLQARQSAFPNLRTHIQDCAACEGELHELRTAIEALRAGVQARAERPEEFWTRQAKRIRRPAERQSQGRRPWVPALVPAFALLAIAAVLLKGSPLSAPPSGPPTASVTANGSGRYADLSDEAVLAMVERTVQQAAPTSLHPAALIADELLAESRGQRARQLQSVVPQSVVPRNRIPNVRVPHGRVEKEKRNEI
ncbi:MAG TPA: hypothetical protein VG892_06990 [Terriglobales bacterium]|jgi:hypothetical protein|nr:hypothetical protein [Terriglobales bacterium]